jgi:hypothetical protein
MKKSRKKPTVTVAIKETPPRARQTGITVVMRAPSDPGHFRITARSLPAIGDPIVEKVLIGAAPALLEEATSGGWTCLPSAGPGLYRDAAAGVRASVSSHLLLLAPGVQLRALALEVLWSHRDYPLVAPLVLGPNRRVMHAGGGFDAETFAPVHLDRAAPMTRIVSPEVRYCPWTVLSAVLIARPLWDDLDGLHSDGDDVGGFMDFALRASERGRHPMVVLDALVIQGVALVPRPDRFAATWLHTGRLAHLLGLVTEPERCTSTA